jgi:hypothetical protein
MNCRAVTSKSMPAHACPYAALEDGLCRVHLRQRQELPAKIARLEAKLETARAKQLALSNPEPIENPS